MSRDLIDAGLFFARVRAGQTFRFWPREGRDVHAGLRMTCVVNPTRDAGDVFVLFRYPNGTEGAVWRSRSDGYRFKIGGEDDVS